MKRTSFPELRRTADYLRTLGYSERSVREITGASRKEIIRDRFLLDLLRREKGNPKGGGGAPCML